MKAIQWNHVVMRAIGVLVRIKKGSLLERVAYWNATLDACEDEMRQEGASDEDISIRMFALCAYCDEQLIGPSAGVRFSAFSQVRRRFAIDFVGEAFFVKAEMLEKNNDIAFMVYWLMFRCGFRGRLDGKEIEADRWERSARARLMDIALLHQPTKRRYPKRGEANRRRNLGLVALCYGVAALLVYPANLVWAIIA